MEIDVRPAALDGYSHTLQVLSAESSGAFDYVTAHEQLRDGGGVVFQHIPPTHATVVKAVSDSLQHAQSLLRSSARELEHAAHEYRQVDNKQATGLGSLHGVAPASQVDAGPTASVAIADRVSQSLSSPQASEPIPDPVDLFMSFPDFVSPSYWLTWAMGQVTGVNPVQWLASELAGDWNGLARFADVTANLAEFMRNAGSQVRRGCDEMVQDWSGAASEAAGTYFSQLADAMGDHADALRSVADQYRQLAYGVWATVKTIVSLVQDLLDSLLAAAVSAAAGAASSWTVVGGLAGGAGTAAALVKASDTWMGIIKAHALAVSMTTGFTGTAAGFLGALEGFSAHPLPAGAYEHSGGH